MRKVVKTTLWEARPLMNFNHDVLFITWDQVAWTEIGD